MSVIVKAIPPRVLESVICEIERLRRKGIRVGYQILRDGQEVLLQLIEGNETKFMGTFTTGFGVFAWLQGLERGFDYARKEIVGCQDRIVVVTGRVGGYGLWVIEKGGGECVVHPKLPCETMLEALSVAVQVFQKGFVIKVSENGE